MNLLLDRLFFWIGLLLMYGIWLGIFRLFRLPTFLLHALAFMMVGRRWGWVISGNLLVGAGLIGVTVLCALWGFLTAVSIRLLIGWLQPGEVLRWIMGYAMGCYVAIPHYGLLAFEWEYDGVAGLVAILAFVITSVVLSRLGWRGEF